MEKEEIKKNILNAIESYSSKGLGKKRYKSKNNKPEKLVVNSIKKWCYLNSIYIHEIESKAVYNVKAGRFLKGQAISGYPDLTGNTSFGVAVYIEVKARGRRSAIKEHQLEFLKNKIMQNCFATCTDSERFINELYYKWVELYKKRKFTECQNLLLSHLTKRRKKPSLCGLSEDELGF